MAWDDVGGFKSSADIKGSYDAFWYIINIQQATSFIIHDYNMRNKLISHADENKPIKQKW